MKRKNTSPARRKRTVAAIRTLWGSLDTHLDLSVKYLTKEQRGAFGGDRKFHADTVREYAKALYDLCQDL